jgi:NhaP-type Na+/H+ or K+/H+ antiporter
MLSKYLSILAFFLVLAALNWIAPALLAHLEALPGVEASIALTLWCLCLFLGGGWACSKLAEGTVLPSFTLQLLAGVILHDALAPLADQQTLSVVVCTALAAIILKGGGDEVERRQFGTIAFPVLMIAVVGYLITFIVMYVLLGLLGLDGLTAALLAAIISSTDPAALIPTLKQLAFKPQFKRISDVAVAESAVNDAVGAIVTTAVATMVLAGASVTTASALLAGLVAPANLLHLGEQFLFGTVAGLIGWAGMYAYERHQSRQQAHSNGETLYDFAIVLAVPLFSFLLAQALHGNGFLAAFIAGLLANYNQGAQRFHTTLHAMEIKIESIAKPTIFMMVGPFVALGDLLDTAWLGLLVALAFMLIARPLAVLISLLPTKLTLPEQWFLCAVRETGVIPVVLAVITVAQFPQLTVLMPLTAWTVIWTLGVLPALTPWWSRKLGLVIT